MRQMSPSRQNMGNSDRSEDEIKLGNAHTAVTDRNLGYHLRHSPGSGTCTYAQARQLLWLGSRSASTVSLKHYVNLVHDPLQGCPGRSSPIEFRI